MHYKDKKKEDYFDFFLFGVFAGIVLSLFVLIILSLIFR